MTNLNIVVAGKAGAGKSSLLNYLVGNEIFETGVGLPVTKDYFDVHPYKDPLTGIQYNLFDTKGVEPDTTLEFEKAFADALKSKTPFVIDCIIDSDDKVWPMVAPGKPINESFDEEDYNATQGGN